MAFFKFLKGLKANLPSEKIAGCCWYTTDESMIYIDFDDENGNVQRKVVNAEKSNLASSINNKKDNSLLSLWYGSKEEYNQLTEYSDDTVYLFSEEQSTPDWSQNDPSHPSYINNRTHWEETHYGKILEDTSLNYPVFDLDYTSIIVGNSYDVTLNGVTYEGCIAKKMIKEGIEFIHIGNPNLFDQYGDPVEQLEGEPFYIGVSSNEGFFEGYNSMLEIHDEYVKLALSVKGPDGNLLTSFTTNWDDEIEIFPPFDLVKGEQYEVTYNGETYSCTAKEIDDGYMSITYLGDIGLLPFPVDSVVSEEPFCIAGGGDYSFMMPTLKLSISGDITTIRKIDEKYLPEKTHWKENLTLIDWDGNIEGKEMATVFSHGSNPNVILPSSNISDFEPEYGTILEETTILNGKITSGVPLLLNNTYPLFLNNEYTVTFNGTPYTCECITVDGDMPLPILGNPALAGGSYDNELPFAIIPVNGCTLITGVDEEAGMPISPEECTLSIDGPIPKDGVIVDNMSISAEEELNYYPMVFSPYYCGLYTIILDGVEYKCQATFFGTGGFVFGNLSIIESDAPNTGEPFVLFVDPNESMIVVLNQSENPYGDCTLSISGPIEPSGNSVFKFYKVSDTVPSKESIIGSKIKVANWVNNKSNIFPDLEYGFPVVEDSEDLRDYVESVVYDEDVLTNVAPIKLDMLMTLGRYNYSSNKAPLVLIADNAVFETDVAMSNGDRYPTLLNFNIPSPGIYALYVDINDPSSIGFDTTNSPDIPGPQSLSLEEESGEESETTEGLPPLYCSSLTNTVYHPLDERFIPASIRELAARSAGINVAGRIFNGETAGYGAEVFNHSVEELGSRNSSIAIGERSHAEGRSTKALGFASHAEGTNTKASGSESHAEGGSTIASGIISHAEGGSTIASGDYSHAEGYKTTASGDYSHAEGSSTTASGERSHAEGYKTKATTSDDAVSTTSSTSKGYYTHAEGYGSVAYGAVSHAEGNGTKASGDYSHSEGWSTEASGWISHAEGYNTEASGEASHAEGRETIASGEFSHAEGFMTRASGERSHAEGSQTYATGNGSHAEGYGSSATGGSSHAEGNGTKASGGSSHAEGYYTQASSTAQHVQGKFNIEDSEDEYSHIVGNGTSNSSRSNAHTLDWDGNAWFAGDVYVGSKSGTNKDEGSVKLQKAITGTAGQFIGFDENGNAVAQDMPVYTASEVGAIPETTVIPVINIITWEEGE